MKDELAVADGDLVFEFIKQEPYNQNDDNYTANDNRSQRDGAPPGSSSECSSTAGNRASASDMHDTKKVSYCAVGVQYYSCAVE